MTGWIAGKISEFNDASTVSGISAASHPGIAYPSDATLGGWWLIRMGGHEFAVQQIDYGPAAWTGRKFDFSAPLVADLKAHGISFRTDETVTAQYLGKSLPPQYRSIAIGSGGAPSGSSSSPATAAPAAAAAQSCLVSMWKLGLFVSGLVVLRRSLRG